MGRWLTPLGRSFPQGRRNAALPGTKTKATNGSNPSPGGLVPRPKVLVACEYSGRVRDGFAQLGWNAWSCDLLPSESPGQHYQGAVEDILSLHWDLMIAHPPCTHLAVSGARWFKDKQLEQQEALAFVQMLFDAPINCIALENPVSIISSRIRKPDQIIQPYQFGHKEAKTTCLWLKNLPVLTPTCVVDKPQSGYWLNQTPSGQNKLAPSPDRWKERSRTYPGIAEAMATQWSAYWHSTYGG